MRRMAAHAGCVMFQFQLGFKPGDDSREHMLYCRRMLRADVPMAVELRNRAWFQSTCHQILRLQVLCWHHHHMMCW